MQNIEDPHKASDIASQPCCHRASGATTRRSFLAGSAMLGMATAGPGVAAESLGAFAQQSPGAIDVLHPIFPPIFSEMWKHSSSWSASTADPVLPHTQNWSPQWMIEQL